jgi:hypothetical protein
MKSQNIFILIKTTGLFNIQNIHFYQQKMNICYIETFF